MRIMGIDHGTSSGICIMEDGNIIYRERLELKEIGNRRLCEFKDRVAKLMSIYEPNVIALEKPAHLRNAEILRYLIGLYSMALEEATRRDIEIVCVVPTTMKKYIAGNGRADKEDMAKAIQRIFNEDYREYIYYKKDKNKVKEIKYDVVDAISLAFYVYKYTKW